MNLNQRSVMSMMFKCYEHDVLKTSKYHNIINTYYVFSGDVVLNNLFIKETALVSICCKCAE